MNSLLIWFVYTIYIYIYIKSVYIFLKSQKYIKEEKAQLLAVHISNIMFDDNIKEKLILLLKIMIKEHALYEFNFLAAFIII